MWKNLVILAKKKKQGTLSDTYNMRKNQQQYDNWVKTQWKLGGAGEQL